MVEKAAPAGDSAVLADAERGEPSAISALYRSYHGPLTAYAKKRGGDDPGGIADLAILDGFRALPRLRSRSEATFRAYVYRAARSRVASEHRRKSMKFELLSEGAAAQIGSGALDPSQVVAARAGFRDLVEMLSPAQQEVIEHRFGIGLSIDETAERVNRSSVAVKQLQAQALKRLRTSAVAALLLIVVFLAVLSLRSAGSRFTTTTDPVDGRPEVVEDGSRGSGQPVRPPVVIDDEGTQQRDRDSLETSSAASSTAAQGTARVQGGQQLPDEEPSTQETEPESAIPSTTLEQDSPPATVDEPAEQPALPETQAPDLGPTQPVDGAMVRMRNGSTGDFLADVDGLVFMTPSAGSGTVWVTELVFDSWRFRNLDSGRYLQSATVEDVQLATVVDGTANTLWELANNQGGEQYLVRSVANGLNLTFRLYQVEVEENDRNRTRWDLLVVAE